MDQNISDVDMDPPDRILTYFTLLENIHTCKKCGKSFTNENRINLQKHIDSAVCRKNIKTVQPSKGQASITAFFSKRACLDTEPKPSTSTELEPVDEDMSGVGLSTTEETAPEKPSHDVEWIIVPEHGEDVTVDSEVIKSKCLGYQPDVPGDLMLNYPFQLHSAESPMKLKFKVVENRLHWNDCTAWENATKPCSELRFDDNVKNIERRSRRVEEHTPFMYLTYDQLSHKARGNAEKVRQKSLEILNLVRSKSRLVDTLSMHKRFLAAVSQNDIPRLRHLIMVCMTQRRSIRFILQRMEDAVSGVYRARGYTDKEKELAFIVLRIGGPKLLQVLQSIGFPGITTVRMAGRQIESQFNIRAAIDNDPLENLKFNLSSIIANAGFDAVWTIKCDEIAIQKRLRWCPTDNKIYGLCHVHGRNLSIDFQSYEDLELIIEELQKETAHLASECLVFVLTRIGDGDVYQTYPLLSLPICSHGDHETQRSIFAFLVENITHGMLLNVGTDGDGVRRRVLHAFNFPEEKVHDALPLFDNPGRITVNKDAKHLMKRFRNRGINHGYTVGPVNFNKELLTRILQHFNKEKVGLLRPDDRQNVAMAHQLLTVLGAISQKHPSEFPKELNWCIPEFKILGAIMDCTLAFYAKYTLDLKEILIEISELSHLLLYVYRKNGSQFIPSQLYYDLQGTVIDVYTNVARLQELPTPPPFYIYQMGSDECELLFSLVRTITHDRNCDSLQLLERLRQAATLKDLFRKHPEWKTLSARRLSVSEAVDHTSYAHWTGDLDVRSVDVKRCWRLGRRKAEVIVTDCHWSDDIPDGITIMKPDGRYVGVSVNDDPVDDDDADDSDLEEVTVEDQIEGAAQLNAFEEEIVPDTSFAKYVNVDGQPTHKAFILRQMVSQSGSLSSDRLRRVRGWSKSPEVPGINNDESPCIMVGDPCVVAVDIGKGRQTFGIIIIDTMNTAVGTSSSASTTLPSSVTGRVLVLDRNDQFLVWNKTMSKVSVTATVFAPIDMDFDLTTSTFSFDIQGLRSKFELLKTRHSTEEVAVPKICTDILPYNVLDEIPQVVIEEEAAKENGWLCNICAETVVYKKFRAHVGYHILTGDISSEVCGFCGEKSGCESWIEITSGRGKQAVKGIASKCTKFMKFSMKAAAKPSRAGPCTNRPVVCREVGCDGAFIWSYDAEAHFARKHPGVSCPEEFKIGDVEKGLMLGKRRK